MSLGGSSPNPTQVPDPGDDMHTDKPTNIKEPGDSVSRDSDSKTELDAGESLPSDPVPQDISEQISVHHIGSEGIYGEGQVPSPDAEGNHDHEPQPTSADSESTPHGQPDPRAVEDIRLCMVATHPNKPIFPIQPHLFLTNLRLG